MEKKIVNGLKEFTKNLKKGIPIEATRIERYQTPDGPMYVRKHCVLLPKK